MCSNASAYSGQANSYKGEALAPLKCRDGSRPSILLAEDSPAARVLTGALLKRIGCDVDAAEDGEEALSYIQKSNYDLILMDIEMPVMDGVVAAREIRTMGGVAGNTPIVALSAFLADTKKSAHWQCHFDLTLAKPAGKHQLYATIGKVLDIDLENSRWMDGEAQRENCQSFKTVQLVEKSKLKRVLLCINRDDKVILLQTVCLEISKYVIELSQSHKNSDLEGMGNALHKLKGLSANFAARSLNHLVSGLQANIDGVSRQDVQDLCQCAGKTSETLLSLIEGRAKVVH